MTTVAERYDVSSNYLARVCEQLKVPRPGRGYWQKLAAGKEPERDPMSELDPGDPVVWKRGVERDYDARATGTPVFVGLGERGTRRETRPKKHPLASGVRDEFLDFRPRKYDRHGYLVPKRGALPDVFVSRELLDGALDLASRLYLAFEDHGHWVRDAAIQGYRRPMLEHEEHPTHKTVDVPAGHGRTQLRPPATRTNSMQRGRLAMRSREVRGPLPTSPKRRSLVTQISSFGLGTDSQILLTRCAETR